MMIEYALLYVLSYGKAYFLLTAMRFILANVPCNFYNSENPCFTFTKYK